MIRLKFCNLIRGQIERLAKKGIWKETLIGGLGEVGIVVLDVSLSFYVNRVMGFAEIEKKWNLRWLNGFFRERKWSGQREQGFSSRNCCFEWLKDLGPIFSFNWKLRMFFLENVGMKALWIEFMDCSLWSILAMVFIFMARVFTWLIHFRLIFTIFVCWLFLHYRKEKQYCSPIIFVSLSWKIFNGTLNFISTLILMSFKLEVCLYR